MRTVELRHYLTVTAAPVLICFSAVPVSAQPDTSPDTSSEKPVVASSHTPPAPGNSDEILVTARKRQESILKVPVVVTAVTGEQINTAQLTQVTDLPRLVPGLVLGSNILSIGPQVTIRGVGTSSYDPGVDQSVSLNIDGLSLGQGLAFGSGMFDVAQVEVLKGPQALFYGKSSPGGVISLRTADPGNAFELIARGSYEFEAREKRGEVIVSGPVSDTLGLRLATTYALADGYFKNAAVAVPGTGAAPPLSREPHPENFIVRGTAVWKPTDTFSARLKLNHAYDHAIHAELFQIAHCPEGVQNFGFGSGAPGSPIPPAPNFLTPVDPIPFLGNDDCKLNKTLYHVYLDPAFFPGVPNDGVPYLKNEQNFGTLELNYDVVPSVTLTSTTAYYKLDSASLVQANEAGGAGGILAVTNGFERRELTQEFRANSDYHGPLNFTLGAFYEDGRLVDHVTFFRNRAYGFLSPAIVGADILNDNRSTTIDITTYSLFGQLRYRLLEQLELAAGVRWSDETREERVFDYATNTDITSTLPRPRIHSSNFSPEITLTYTPTDDLTVFGSYKKGYKSGSFKVAVPPVPGENNAFDDENVQGYEIGLKSRFLDRSLMMNLAFYDYRYKGLQVGGIEPFVNGSPVIRTVNAGKSRTYGIDFDVAYHPRSIDGLSLNASVNWNRARYKELNNIPCYIGQTVAQGCTTFFAASPDQSAPGAGAVLVNGQYGFYTGQDLSNTQMIRAPEWAANFGFDYEFSVGSGMKLHLNNNNQYSARFPTFLAVGRPNEDNFQGGFLKVDATVALSAEDNRWEVALIGRNITDKLTASNCNVGNYSGGNVVGGSITGGSTSGPPGFGEVGCFSEPGRAVYLRLTVRGGK
jgi:iron complex outermembrane receptor protein